MHSPTEPFDRGLLDVGDGHEIYWEVSGNPAGQPAIYLHGGPGGAPAGKGWRSFFDPETYRILLFHQRGCGNSRPLASDPDADLSVNTTSHLVADIEALRTFFGVERWTMLGLSWGTTLGLAYAETHPDRVSGLVLGLVTLTTRREVDWMTRDLRRLHPEEWERFAAIVPASLQGLPIVDAYAELLADPDPYVRDRAAHEWIAWDHTQMGNPPSARYHDPDVRLASARLITHYWRNSGFLDDDQLLRDAGRLDGIPGAIVQGAHDVSCPPDLAWDLAQRWTTAELTIVDAGHGHSRTTPDAFPAAVTAALDRLRLP
ncbi:alpha/beta hydrolase family protein [Flindersiella endophytica]